MPTTDTVTLESDVTRLGPALVETRRTLHQAPELGFEETQTAGLVAERLKALGLEVQTGVAKTGVVSLLRGARPGPTLLLRADMDGLPVQEGTGRAVRVPARGPDARLRSRRPRGHAAGRRGVPAGAPRSPGRDRQAGLPARRGRAGGRPADDRRRRARRAAGRRRLRPPPPQRPARRHGGAAPGPDHGGDRPHRAGRPRARRPRRGAPPDDRLGPGGGPRRHRPPGDRRPGGGPGGPGRRDHRDDPRRLPLQRHRPAGGADGHRAELRPEAAPGAARADRADRPGRGERVRRRGRRDLPLRLSHHRERSGDDRGGTSGGGDGGGGVRPGHPRPADGRGRHVLLPRGRPRLLRLRRLGEPVAGARPSPPLAGLRLRRGGAADRASSSSCG